MLLSIESSDRILDLDGKNSAGLKAGICDLGDIVLQGNINCRRIFYQYFKRRMKDTVGSPQ